MQICGIVRRQNRFTVSPSSWFRFIRFPTQPSNLILGFRSINTWGVIVNKKPDFLGLYGSEATSRMVYMWASSKCRAVFQGVTLKRCFSLPICQLGHPLLESSLVAQL